MRRQRSGSVGHGPAHFRCECVYGTHWQCEEVDFAVDVGPQNLIGRGALGAVYRVNFKGHPAAGKTFHAFADPATYGIDLQASQEQLAALAREVEPEITVLASILRHPSLGGCLGVGYATLASVEVPVWIVMELAEENLHELLHGDMGGALSPVEAMRRWVQLLIGLDVLHAVGIVHRNIRPSNILLRGRRGRLALADYGLSHLRRNVAMLMGAPGGGITGHPAYQGPEGSTFSKKGDMYAAAIILAEMLTGEEPSESHDDRLQWVEHASELLPSPASGTLVRAASTDPRSRPAVAEALFAVFDSLTTMDLGSLRRDAHAAESRHNMAREANNRIQSLEAKAEAWEELYHTAAKARDDMQERLNEANRRNEALLPESSEVALEALEEAAATLAEQCERARLAEQRILNEEDVALQAMERLAAAAMSAPASAVASTSSPALAVGAIATLEQAAAALEEQCKLAEAAEQRFLEVESAKEPEDAYRDGARRPVSPKEDEDRPLILALRRRSEEQEREIARLRAELAAAEASHCDDRGAESRADAVESSSAPYISLAASKGLPLPPQASTYLLEPRRLSEPWQARKAAAALNAAVGMTAPPWGRQRTNSSTGSSDAPPAKERSSSTPQSSPQARGAMQGASNLGRRDGSCPTRSMRVMSAPEDANELQKKLIERRNKVGAREQVFFSTQPPQPVRADASAMWERRRTEKLPAGATPSEALTDAEAANADGGTED